MKIFRFVSLMILTVVFLLINQPVDAVFISENFKRTNDTTGLIVLTGSLCTPGFNNHTDWTSDTKPYYGFCDLVPEISDEDNVYDSVCSVSLTPVNTVTPTNDLCDKYSGLVFPEGFFITAPSDFTPEPTSIFLLSAGLFGIAGFGQKKRRYQILDIFDHNHKTINERMCCE